LGLNLLIIIALDFYTRPPSNKLNKYTTSSSDESEAVAEELLFSLVSQRIPLKF
jgi:hypothetical protein